MVHFLGLLQLKLFNDLCPDFCHKLVYDCSISLLELSDILGSNCVEVKLCVLMVWLVMCLCLNKAIA